MIQFTVMVKKCQSVEFLNHNTTVCLAHIVKLMLAKNPFQEMRESQISQNTAQCDFFLIPAQRTL
jgi:hypothetical protein